MFNNKNFDEALSVALDADEAEELLTEFFCLAMLDEMDWCPDEPD